MSKVAIIGGGIIGLCTAYYLRREGHQVLVIDRHEINDGCSFGNMGYMSPSHFIPLASPGIIAEGFRHMLSSSSPFYIKPRLDWDLIKWGMTFFRNSNQQTVLKNAPHLNNILKLSRDLIEEIRNEIGGDFDMQEIGCMMMCKKESTLDHEFELADEAEKFGLKVERLRRQQVQDLETDVETDVAGAVLFRDDCHFNPGKFMQLLKSYLHKTGVEFKFNHEVTGFEKRGHLVTSVITLKEKISADHIVIAAGSWLPEVTKMLGKRILLQAGKGYSYTYQHVEPNIKYPAILVDGRCAITPWKNSLRIGGTMEISGINNKILVKRMEGIYHSATSFYPGLKIPFPPKDKIWSGLRPVTPDGLPYIGKLNGNENVLLAGGHAMLGVSQAPGTGKIISQLINHQEPEIDISAFEPGRFGY